MKIIDIKIKDKGGEIRHLQEGILIEELGIKGDVNANGGVKQISILTCNDRRSSEKLRDKGLCILRFYENLTIENLDIKKVYIGRRFKINNTIVEISKIGKYCFDNCQLVKENKKCSLSTNTIFAKVVEGGKIKLDDKITPLD